MYNASQFSSKLCMIPPSPFFPGCRLRPCSSRVDAIWQRWWILDLPPTSDSQHNLRKRRHNITLPEKKRHLAAKNFIIRLLYKDTYWLLYWLSHNLSFSLKFFLPHCSPLRSVSWVFHNKDWIGLDWIQGLQHFCPAMCLRCTSFC